MVFFLLLCFTQDDCVLLYRVNLTMKNQAEGDVVDEVSAVGCLGRYCMLHCNPSSYRSFLCAVCILFQHLSRHTVPGLSPNTAVEGPMAGRPTVREPPLNLFDGPSDPTIFVLSPRSVPPTTSVSPQTRGTPSSSHEGRVRGEAPEIHGWQSCPRRSQPPPPSLASVSLSPYGPHRTLLGTALPRSATGLSAASTDRANLTSLCEGSTSCRRRTQNFVVRHADDHAMERRDFCRAPGVSSNNPVVQFLEDARHRAASPPPSGHRQGLGMSTFDQRMTCSQIEGLM